MQTIVILLGLLASMNSAYADQSISYLGLEELSAQPLKKNSYQWKMTLNGASWEENTNKSVGFNTRLQTKLTFQINQKFNIKLDTKKSKKFIKVKIKYIENFKKHN